MHRYFLTFTFLATFLFVRDALACMHYAATFPYSTSLPFEATLIDNGVVTCWVSTTYVQHNKQQIAFSQHRHPKPKKRQSQAQVSLTEKPDFSMPTSPTRSGSQKKGGEKGIGSGQGVGKDIPEWDNDEEENGAGIWLPWEFECLNGYQAHAGIGLRAVWYRAHGQDFEFVPHMYEDVLGEKWVYTLDLWCDGS